MIRKVKKFFEFIGALFYFLFYRIKNIGKKKNVAQVLNSFNSGGLEQVAANVYKSFLKNGNGSYVISISNTAGPICQQLESPKHFRMIYYNFSAMLKFCAKNNIGTLIYHFSTFKLPQFKMLGFKTYYVIHNTYLWYTEGEWQNLKIKMKFTNGIIAVSEWCKDYFIKKTGISKVKVILNGIDFQNLQSGNISTITRKSLGIKNDDIVVLTVGSYTDQKHQMAILGIAEQMIKKYKNMKFLCAGPILNRDLFKLFKRELKKSSANKNVIILEYVPQDQMGDFIHNVCDIYLQPSIHEAGVPLTVMEALIKKKPVIMTDFMLDKTFPVIDRIVGVRPPYEDLMSITPKKVIEMTKKKVDSSTNEYVRKLEDIVSNLDYYRDESNFNIDDYAFLSMERMAQEYIDYIII